MRSAAVLAAGGLALAIVGLAGPAQAAPAYPAAHGRCVDEVGVLGDDLCARITTVLTGDEKATSDEIAVVVVPTTGDATIETWGTGLFNDEYAVGDLPGGLDPDEADSGGSALWPVALLGCGVLALIGIVVGIARGGSSPSVVSRRRDSITGPRFGSSTDSFGGGSLGGGSLGGGSLGGDSSGGSGGGSFGGGSLGGDSSGGSFGGGSSDGGGASGSW